MSDEQKISPVPESEHGWVHEHLGAYLAGGLSDAERGRLDAHINGCPACFDDFTEAREADRALLRTLSPLAPGGGAGGHLFEERVVHHFRERSMKRWKRPMIRRAGYAAAAAVALAATGVFANYVIRQNGRFNNPMSQQLASDADARAPELSAMVERITHAMGRTKVAPAASPTINGESPGNWVDDGKNSPAATQRMRFDYAGASASTVLGDVSKAFGVEIIQPQTPIGGKITITTPGEVDRTSAYRLVNNILTPLGFTVIGDGGNAGTWRVMNFEQAKKSSIPVFHENDPANIPNTDDLITDVIAVKNIDAVRTRADIAPLVSADADFTANQASNSIVVTDTAAKIRRLVSIVNEMDKNGANAPRFASTVGSRTATIVGAAGGGGLPGGAQWQVAGESSAQANRDSAVHLIPFDDTLLRQRNTLQQREGQQQGVKGVLAYNISGQTGESAENGRKQEDAGKFSIGAGVSTGPGLNGLLTSNTREAALAGGSPGAAGANWEMNAVDGTGDGNGKLMVGAGTMTLTNSFRAPSSVSSGNLLAAGSVGNGASGQPGQRYFFAPNGANRDSFATSDGEKQAVVAGKELFVNGGPVVAGEEDEAKKGLKNLPLLADAPDLGESFKDTADKSQGGADHMMMIPANEKREAGEALDAKQQQALAGQVVNVLDRRDSKHSLAADPGEPGAPATQPIAATSTPTASIPAPTVPSTAPAIANQLKIIRSGTIEFEVRSFDDAYGSVAKIVQDEGGFVSSTSSDKLPNGKVKGTIVVRVPPEKLDRFLLSLRALGDLKSQQISAADVTKEYTDTDSELRGLRTMETRLLDLIKNGKGEVKDLIAAETKLGETRIQIEKLEGQLKYFDNLVGMATITITAYEKDIATPTAASEQENIRMNMETEEVEAQYQAARKILTDAKGRIIESQMNNSDGEHIAAHILAEVPPDKADFVSNQLKGLGKVISYGRDRKQTTSGGTGVPAPDVHVEEKDTRVTVDLLNLANLNPRETTVLRIAVPNVEATYRKALAQLRAETPEGGAPAVAPVAPQRGGDTTDDTHLLQDGGSRPAGHVLSSNVTGQKPEQMTAEVRAEIRADQADAFLAMLRNSGEVLISTVQSNPDTAGTTSAKRGLQLSLVNGATVAPREVVTVNVAVHDVDKAYKDLLALIQKDVAAGGAAATQPAASQPAATESALLPATVGRVKYSNINGQQPEQMTADVQAEIRTDQADAVMQALRTEGELMNNSLTQNPDNSNTTLVKRGLQVRFINQAAIPARETVTLHAVAENVPAAYNKLQATLQDQVTAGNVRIISSVFNQSDAQNVNATLAFEVSRTALAAVETAFKSADIDFLSRNITRSTDTAGTLDSKVRFQVDELRSAETLLPTRTFTLGMEVDDVERSMSDLRTFAATLAKPAHEADFNVSREASGRTTGHLVLDFPSDEQLSILAHLRDLKGFEISNQMAVNTQVPDTRFNKERVDLTLISKAGIVQSDKGLWQSIRAALTSSTGALLYSLYLVLTGLLFVLPFVLILWPIVAFKRRRKTA